MNVNAREYLQQTYSESVEIKAHFMETQADTLVQAAQLLGQCLSQGGKLLICGNGGSAADAQHMAAEMVGRMLLDRRPLPAIALSTDSSNLTALGNDFGFETVFAKQVEALAQPGDLLLAISTSGNSANVLAAAKMARQKKCQVIGLTGGEGGELKALSDFCLVAATGKNSSRIQETHIFAIHSLVDLMDRFFSEGLTQ